MWRTTRSMLHKLLTSLVLPAKSAMCLYSGTPFSAAPALATASDTARIAFAPSLPYSRKAI